MPVKRRKGKQQGKQGKQGKQHGGNSSSSKSKNVVARALSGTDDTKSGSTSLDHHGLLAQNSNLVGEASSNSANASDTNPLGSSSSSDQLVAHPNHNLNQNNDLILTCTEKRRGVYECDYCHNDISQLPRIRCAVCIDFDLCLDCFANTDQTTFKQQQRNKGTNQTGVSGATTPTGISGGSSVPSSRQDMGQNTTTSTTILSSMTTQSHDPAKHGYRVCDSTRYPLFPTTKQITDNMNQIVATNQHTKSVAALLLSATSPPQEEKNDSSNNNNDETLETGTMSDPEKLVSFYMQCDNDPKNYWTVEEDLRLLDGIKTHGLGNWIDIADAVGGQGSTGKTPKRCMERYFDDFLGRYGSILPPYTLVPAGSQIIVRTNNINHQQSINHDGKKPPEEAEKIIKELQEIASTPLLMGKDTVSTNEDFKEGEVQGISTDPSEMMDESSTLPADTREIGCSSNDDKKQPETVSNTRSSPENIQATNVVSEIIKQALPTTTPDANLIRTSKRRAAMMSRSPSTSSFLNLTSFSQLASSAMSAGDFFATAAICRKKYKAVETDILVHLTKNNSEPIVHRPLDASGDVNMLDEDNKLGCEEPESNAFHHLWPEPFIPNVAGKTIQVGQEVGRDQATKAEQAYVKAIAACENKMEVEKVRQEWIKNRLNKPGGPTALPMRPEDISTLPGTELAGFMPRRGDFDIEWENDAEAVVADMEFIPGESDEDRQLKLRVLEIYSRKLNEREKRKNFVISRKLYDYRKHQQEYYQKLPRDERDLVLRMRLFERFHTPEEHKQFIADLLKAKRLRKEIAKIQMYRRMGIRTLFEAEMYELDKARRQSHKTASIQKEIESRKGDKHYHQHQMTSAPGGGIGPSTTATGGLSARGGGGMLGSLGGGDGFNDFDERESSIMYWKQYRTTERKVRKSINRGGQMGSEDTQQLQNKGNDVVDTVLGAPTQMIDEERTVSAAVGLNTSALVTDMMGSNIPQSGSLKLVDSIAPVGSQPRGSIDLNLPPPNAFRLNELLPGYDLLSSKEIKLCESLRIEPIQYLDIKKVLIHESLKRGLLERNRQTKPNSTLMKLDVERRGMIIDFVIRAGWIPTTIGTPLVHIFLVPPIVVRKCGVRPSLNTSKK